MHSFRIPIGDWSDDGHGHCDYYTVICNKSSEEFTAAYNKAARAHPTLVPTTFCDRYNDDRIPEHIIEALEKDKQYKILVGFDEEYHIPEDFPAAQLFWDMSKAFADYVIWFVRLGDPEIEATVLPELPMWYPPRGDTSHIGYGLYNG